MPISTAAARAACASLLAVTVVACQSLGSTATATATPSAPNGTASPAVRDAHEQLQSVLWMQTSGEYWANAATVYAAARQAIDRGLKDRRWTAALEQEGSFARLPPAVILDLDETVLDNSRFQGRMIREGKSYDATAWKTWVEERMAVEVPGAVGFIDYAASKKVRVFFVTNRTAAQETATIENLARMTVTTTADQILSSDENGWTSDKTARRAFLAKQYRILALVGDDLNDFVAANDQTPSDRVKTVRTHAARWGAQWFILPNPVYGGWDRSLYPGVSGDEAIRARKRSLVTGF
jgi:5'-nucleotidase (lipoprotein e(P4) family)